MCWDFLCSLFAENLLPVLVQRILDEMQQRKLGVLGFIQQNLCGFLKNKPPVAILMAFILSLSFFLLVLSYYVQKNDIVDDEATQVGIFHYNL